MRSTSYTSVLGSLAAPIRELRFISRVISRGAGSRVSEAVAYARNVECQIHARFGVLLEDLDVLDVGSGQVPLQLLFFASRNRAVGIDTDIIVTKFDPRQYVAMIHVNGMWRTLKTAARKSLGADRRLRAELQRQMGVAELPPVKVLLQDACDLRFPDISFDFVHSRSVFHHIKEPAAAFREVARVLRPGGVAHIGFHLYTSPNGSLDPRRFRDAEGHALLWPHLRPRLAGRVGGNAFLNKLRLHEWRQLATDTLTGAELLLNPVQDIQAQHEAESLIAGGELSGYSKEELLVHDVTILWRKPLVASNHASE